MTSRVPSLTEPAAGVQAAPGDGRLPAAAAPREPEPAAGSFVLRWTVHPAATQRLRTLAVVLAILLVAALVGSVSGSVVSAALATVLLVGSLRAWFLPRTYVLDGSGVAESGPLQAPRRLAWEDVRTVTRERHGVHLSPLHRPSRWVTDRGVFLRTDDRPDLAGEVTDLIHRQRGA